MAPEFSSTKIAALPNFWSKGKKCQNLMKVVLQLDNPSYIQTNQSRPLTVSLQHTLNLLEAIVGFWHYGGLPIFY